MALHLKKDFAKLCGMATNAFAVYVKRGKVTLSGDYVDDSLPENKQFLLKRQVKVEDAPSATRPMPEVGETKAPNLPKPRILNVKEPEHNGGFELDNQLKSLDIEKKTEEIQLLQMKKEKQQGVVIPTDLVKILFTQHSKAIVSSFHNAADTFLMVIAKKKDIDRTEMAELRGQLIGVINTAVEDSIKESKKQIKNIVAQYSEKKGVGERI